MAGKDGGLGDRCEFLQLTSCPRANSYHPIDRPALLNPTYSGGGRTSMSLIREVMGPTPGTSRNLGITAGLAEQSLANGPPNPPENTRKSPN